MEEPPDEKNGRGIPVAGTAPLTTAIFISDCSTIISAQPNAHKLLNLSGHLNAIEKARQAKNASRIKYSTTPISPIASAQPAKIKSA